MVNVDHSKYKDRLIPEQNKALIAGICICQMTVVLSLVALMYLSVAVYMPSHRAFNSGFESDPVTCQTIETITNNNCSWASCGEWCLTRASGFCPQIHVTVRRNGTDILLENCTRMSNNACLQVTTESLKRYNCNNGSTCNALTGVFNCSLGHCANMSEVYQCHYKADGIIIDSEKDNMKLNGFFECKKSRCTKIKKLYYCDRFCPKITTSGVNAYLMYDNYLYSGDCQRAVALNKADGTNPGHPINATEIWTEEKSKGMLIASCQKVEKYGYYSLRAYDCINGTVMPESQIPTPFVNFTTFWSLVDKSVIPVDPLNHYLPNQKALTIYNVSRLYINLEGCVNTLKGECKEFLKTHGHDGRNNTAQSRFPCFYHATDSFKVISRYDLEKTWRELLIALVVPIVLFVTSFTTLLIITRSVKVGDDAILRCMLCPGDKSTPRHQQLSKTVENNTGLSL